MKQEITKRKKIPGKVRDELIKKAVWNHILESYDYVNIMGVNTLVPINKKKQNKFKV